MITKRRILRAIPQVAVLTAVIAVGGLQVWWYGYALAVAVVAYGGACWLEGFNDGFEQRRKLYFSDDRTERAASAIDEYLRTGNLDALARYDAIVREVLRG